jgi:hypothetical protein
MCTSSIPASTWSTRDARSFDDIDRIEAYAKKQWRLTKNLRRAKFWLGIIEFCEAQRVYELHRRATKYEEL